MGKGLSKYALKKDEASLGVTVFTVGNGIHFLHESLFLSLHDNPLGKNMNPLVLHLYVWVNGRMQRIH